MLKLILLRHAKSAWGDPGVADHARPLNGRGRRSAAAIGAWLADRGDVPQEVLSSDSHRTRETWEVLDGTLHSGADVAWRSDLYHAGPDRMLRVLQKASAPTVLLQGHNPGCAAFAEMIAAKPPDHPRFGDYPTAAVLVVELAAASWPQVTWRMGTPTGFAVPRDLGVA